MKQIVVFLLICVVFSACKVVDNKKHDNNNPFRKANIIPWSIVGFDVKERNPEERIEMIQKLGYKQYAYGYRPQHIPSMKHEWELAKEKRISIQAVWLYINLYKEKVGALKPDSEIVFENLKATGVQTQIWVGFEPTYFDHLSEGESLQQATEMIAYLSQRAKSVNCKIALYNHGGWFGKPENQIKIIKALPKNELGIIFNFHHAHDDLENYSKNITELFPYLWCVNLNGMRKEGPKIITIGQGNLEKIMIEKLFKMGYKGPFGILGHVKGGDPEVILQENYTGLQTLFPKVN
ncbi:hypothetical protein SLW70_02235 [Flavobacterium sp. NG2]|uniref:sugar phosphate isomerase/epimerase family protein n=1 Tax=Flavobacterium sp. NG2 TaxID=3097547 RepID=UPI002A833322|nr:hypothetical protein [Flavobacterium sp. NG2]WPR71971.1 hypothetical protein SLW70_02235 [Flavobacterium sp. NG2]